MKKVLGLDLGTTSIGWALAEEAENKEEKSSIIRLGAMVNPLTTDEKSDFEKGKPISTNAKRDKKGRELERENYEWRTKALSEQIDLEELTVVFQEINNQIQKSTTYLGKISDRHKELFFNNMTVGQYLVARLDADTDLTITVTDDFGNVYMEHMERPKEFSVQMYMRPQRNKVK